MTRRGKRMRKLFLSVVMTVLFVNVLPAQEENSVRLEPFESCNNGARHYCQSGNHERAVNRRLLNLKKKGYVITNELVKSYAQKTRPDTPVR